MGLTMRERHAVVRELARRYQKDTKKQRGRLLDEFVHLTGYSRCYAAFVLRNCGKKQTRILGGKRVESLMSQGKEKIVRRRSEYPKQIRRAENSQQLSKNHVADTSISSWHLSRFINSGLQIGDRVSG